MSEVLITPRRNFLIRALGFTAAGATLSVPVLALDSPKARMQHHIDGLQAALGDCFSGMDVYFKGYPLNWAKSDPPILMFMVDTSGYFDKFTAGVIRRGAVLG